MTLAEIIEEGERLIAARTMSPQHSMTHYIEAGTDLARFMVRYGPALLAVAKAAVEMRTFIAHDTSDMDPGDTLGWNAMIDAFDAAVRGDAATGEGR